MFDGETKTTITKVLPKCKSAKEIGEYPRKWVLKHTAKDAIVITDGELEDLPRLVGGLSSKITPHPCVFSRFLRVSSG